MTELKAIKVKVVGPRSSAKKAVGLIQRSKFQEETTDDAVRDWQ